MKAVFYALGGGQGHATRAFNLARRFALSTVFVSRPRVSETTIEAVCVDGFSPRQLSRALEAALADADAFIVDTFPAGIDRRLQLPDHVPTTLVARYLRRAHYPDYDQLAARYDHVWLPYDERRCEWERPPHGVFIGPITRDIDSNGQTDVLSIGPVPPAWQPLLAGAYHIDGPFDALPRARRTIALAAGYNLAWELVEAGHHVGFRPHTRHYDDQFRRAAMLGTPLLHRRDLEAFLC